MDCILERLVLIEHQNLNSVHCKRSSICARLQRTFWTYFSEFAQSLQINLNQCDKHYKCCSKFERQQTLNLSTTWTHRQAHPIKPLWSQDKKRNDDVSSFYSQNQKEEEGSKKKSSSHSTLFFCWFALFQISGSVFPLHYSPLNLLYKHLHT